MQLVRDGMHRVRRKLLGKDYRINSFLALDAGLQQSKQKVDVPVAPAGTLI